MRRRKVTSYDIAREAGVSQTTVSLVLNNSEKANISDEVRQRVIRVAKELNYPIISRLSDLYSSISLSLSPVDTDMRTRCWYKSKVLTKYLIAH